MPETVDPVQNFLKSYFMIANHRANGQLAQQKLAFEQQKFNAEQANHQADMKQRADQFGQEISLRKDESEATAKFREATLGQGNLARQDASQERFRQAGGQLFDSPNPNLTRTDTVQAPLPQVPGLTAAPAANPPTQPVGPTQPDTMGDLASGRQVANPPAMTPTPLASTVRVPTSAQGPDPSRYRPTQAPLGTPAGQTAYFPTLLGRAEETKDADNEANQMEVTPELAGAMPDAGLTVGSKIDRRLIPIIQKGMEYKQTQAEHVREFGETLAQRKQAEADAMQIKQGLMALKASSGANNGDIGKMYGESALDNPDAKIPEKFQPAALAYLRDPANGYNLKSLPAPIQASDVQPVEAAVTAMNMGNELKSKLKDPLISNNLGPIMGPMQDLTKRLGTDPRFANNPGAMAALQTFRSENVGNFVNELKSINPRAAASLQGLVDKMAPNERMTPAMFEGAVNGMMTVAYNRIKAVRDRQFGGTAPDSVMAKYPKPQQPISRENPLWRKQGDANFIDKDDSKVVNAGGQRVWIYHDGSNDKYYQLATLPPDVK